MHAKHVGFVAGVLLAGMAGMAPAQVVAQYDDACKRDPVYAKTSTYCLCLKDKKSDACKCGQGG